MEYDYSKLRGKIREEFGKEYAFAKAMGMAQSTLSKKLNNLTDWTGADITKACGLLHIPIQDAPLYFFYVKKL